MRQLILVTGVLILIAVLSPAARACSCGGPGTPCESYGSAAAVFVGTAKSVREVDAKETGDNFLSRVFKFEVEQSYLGVAETEVEISTGMGGGDCGYRFNLGTRYLIYAHRYRNRLATGICTRTRPFAQATEDLAFLGNLTSASRGATIYGQLVRTTPQKDSPPFKDDVLIRIEGGDVRKEIRPDPQGRYRVEGLPPGKYKVVVQLPETLTAGQPEREVSVSDRGCASVVYYINDNGRLSGRVIDPEGQPVPRIMVSVVEATADPRTSFVTLDRTDQEGRFNFSPISPGRYLIAVNFHRYREPNDPTNAYAPTFYPGVEDRQGAEVIVLASGETRTGLDIRVPLRRPSSVIKGQIVWSDGSPVTAAFLSVADVTDGQSGVRNGVEVDQQGRFTLNGFVGQKLVLEARSNRPYVRSAANDPMERSEPVRITLQRPTETVRIVITKLR